MTRLARRLLDSIDAAQSVVALGLAALAGATALGPLRANDETLLACAHAPARVLAPGAHRAGEVIVAFAAGDERRRDGALAPRGRRARRRAARDSGRACSRSSSRGRRAPRRSRASRACPGVAYAEPNGLVAIDQAATFKPNDSLYRFQWNLTQVGAERTWGIQKGKPSVAVAVLDTGVAYEDYGDPNTGQQFRKAPDWGDTRFLPGFDFFNGDAHPNDDEGHGTHVASTDRRGHEQRRRHRRARVRLRDHAGEGAGAGRRSAASSTSPTGSTTPIELHGERRTGP